jgi:hypothetical protein
MGFHLFTLAHICAGCAIASSLFLNLIRLRAERGDGIFRPAGARQLLSVGSDASAPSAADDPSGPFHMNWKRHPDS